MLCTARRHTVRYTQRVERLDRALQPPQQVKCEVILIGKDEPEPPHEPGIEVIHVTLGDTPPEEARHSTR
jgi:hypothetical protein